MFYLKDETCLGGMSVKWKNGTDRQIDRYTDEKRASQTLPPWGVV
jgi:hypothetical protein